MGSLTKATRLVGAFLRDERGAMTILALLMTVMLLGFGALVVDIGRLYNLHSQMQSYVDQVALAAAAELDGEADAITRATRATPLVRDVQNFAVGAAELAIQSPVFYSQIPPDNAANYEALLAAFATTDPAEAAFVRVRATPRQENFFLMPLAALIGSRFDADMATTATAEAQAIAGFKREVCNAPPLMICNPYEMDDGVPGGGFTPVIGQQVLAKAGAYEPGNYGLLQAAEDAGEPICKGGGADRIRCVLGLVDPNTRCIRGVVDTKTGVNTSVNAGINVRFDIWDNSLAKEQNKPAFRPSVNVTKGQTHKPNQCSSNQLIPPPPAPDNTMALPKDACFLGGTCWHGNPRFGMGNDWDRNGYWNANHPGVQKPQNYADMKRYDIYRYEIDNNLIPNKSPKGENGNRTCAPSGVDDPQRDRRVLTVAVLNCKQHNVHGHSVDVPVVAFARMFITEPVGYLKDTKEDDLYVEMLGVVEPGDEPGILHEFPVLYR